MSGKLENCSEQSMVTAILDLPISHFVQHFHCCMRVSCQHFTKTLISETAPWCGDISSFIKNEGSCAVYRCIRFLIFFFMKFYVIDGRTWSFIKWIFLRAVIVRDLKAKSFQFVELSSSGFKFFHLCCFIL